MLFHWRVLASAGLRCGNHSLSCLIERLLTVIVLLFFLGLALVRYRVLTSWEHFILAGILGFQPFYFGFLLVCPVFHTSLKQKIPPGLV